MSCVRHPSLATLFLRKKPWWTEKNGRPDLNFKLSVGAAMECSRNSTKIENILISFLWSHLTVFCSFQARPAMCSSESVLWSVCPEGMLQLLLWLGFIPDCKCLMAQGVGTVQHFLPFWCNQHFRKNINVSDKVFPFYPTYIPQDHADNCAHRFGGRWGPGVSTPLVWLLVLPRFHALK